MESFSLLFTVCSFRLKRTSLICACEVRPPIRVKYSSVVQQVERVTVNHDDTGSSPVRGERKNFVTATGFSLGNINKNYLWLKTKKKLLMGINGNGQLIDYFGMLLQLSLVEREIEALGVGGSKPSGSTKKRMVSFNIYRPTFLNIIKILDGFDSHLPFNRGEVEAAKG